MGQPDSAQSIGFLTSSFISKLFVFAAVPAVTMGRWERFRGRYNACKVLTEGHWFKLESAHGRFEQGMVVGVEN